MQVESSSQRSEHGQDAAAFSPALSVELERLLLRELLRTWHGLNYSLFRRALRAPSLMLTDSRSLLGRWDASRRVLELSRPLVLEASWGSIVEVLKHEMAHQYASDVLGAAGEPAHGPAFRRTCERLGIDPLATGISGAAQQQDDPARARLLKRVTGLLALAESPNRHEAETAAAVAQRLMLKHNISLTQTQEHQRYSFRHLGEPKGRVQEYEHILASILAEHYFVEAIWVPAFRPLDGKRGNVLEICGSLENLEIAGYVHAFLLGTSERLWREHKRASGIKLNRYRRSFIAGVMEGFRDRLRAEQRRSQEQGLVWVGDADLSGFYRRRHPHIRSVRLRVPGRSEARNQGRTAGRGIVLRRGVAANSSGAGTRPLLRGATSS